MKIASFAEVTHQPRHSRVTLFHNAVPFLLPCSCVDLSTFYNLAHPLFKSHGSQTYLQCNNSAPVFNSAEMSLGIIDKSTSRSVI